MEGDDCYVRRTFTMDSEADAILTALHRETGKPMSQLICLALLSLRGNQRLVRHALAQPVNALRLNLDLAARCVDQADDGMVEVVRAMQEQVRRIDAALAPNPLT